MFHYYAVKKMLSSRLVCDPTIRQLGFDLPRQWSLVNRFRTEQGHCGACRKKWRLTDTDLCPCGKIQMMSNVVISCPLTKLNGGLFRLHSADEEYCFVADQLWFMTRIRAEEEVKIFDSSYQSLYIPLSFFLTFELLYFLISAGSC